MSEKPTGLLIVIALLCIFGVLGFIEILFFSRRPFFITSLLALLRVIQVILAIGLWSLNKLALKVTRALLMVLLIIALFSLQILDFIIYALMFWYLFNPEVKSAFK